jgi:hypothetical protein
MHKTLVVSLFALSLTGLACSDRQTDTLAEEDRPEAGAYEDYSTSREVSIAQGQLARIDSDNDFIWVKMPDGQEMQFSYTFMTEVEGVGEAAEGLVDDVESIPQGSDVRVHYEAGVDEDVLSDDEINTAVKIEIERAL